MVVKHGTSRVVILLPFLGIIVKFPKFYLRKAWKIFFGIFKYRKSKNRYRMFVFFFREAFITQNGEDKMPFFWMFLFQGLFDNLSEFIFYLLHFNNKFLVPTYFSLFGLLNIQPLQKNVCKIDKDVWYHLLKNAPQKELWGSSKHTLSSATNFSTDNKGKLKIMDYANRGVQRMTKKYGNKFHSVLVTDSG